MVQRVVVRRTGGPEVMGLEDVEVGQPGPGEALVRHTAIGLNYIDTYFRSGLYPAPGGLPFTPGSEGAGVVEAVGDGVADLAPGDRVGYAAGPGAYTASRVMPIDRLVPLPPGISDEVAAAIMLKGMTAQYLFKQAYKVQPGDPILFHAAAGGVGLIACQWAKALGAVVIGTVGSKEKAELAKQHGCDHVILYKEEDVAARVAEITGGKKCPVVYDGVGKATLAASLDSLRPRGLLASFGNASGAIENFNLGLLSQKGSLYVTRPTLFTYTSNREELLACAADLFAVVADGTVQVRINQRWPLTEVVAVHRALEARETTGSTLLIP